MTKFQLGSSAVAALLISSVPAVAQDRTIAIDQHLEQELNQTCSGTGVDPHGNYYALKGMNSNGDCVAVLLGDNFAIVTDSNNTGQVGGDHEQNMDGGHAGSGQMGYRTIGIDQELEQELNQTNSGDGDTTAEVEGSNTAVVKNSNNTDGDQMGGSGDRTIGIDQELEQNVNQTNSGDGDTTAEVEGSNTAKVEDSNNSGE